MLWDPNLYWKLCLNDFCGSMNSAMGPTFFQQNMFSVSGQSKYSLRACLLCYNGNYIGIRISLTMNTRRCNVILITIYLFGNNTIIEPWKQWNESI